jgi:hypothetical protein
MNLSTDMTIIEIDNLIKSLPKERLQKELESPTGHFPLYLVAGRLKEMESMEADAQAAAAEKKTSEQAPSVAHRLAMTQPPVMSEVAAAPQPQPQPDPAGQAAQMLTPTVNAAEGYGLPTVYAEKGTENANTSELVNQYLAELKSRKDKAREKRLRTDEFAVDNRGSFAQDLGKQPFGKGGLADLGSLADLRAAQVEREERSDPTPTPSDQKAKGRFMGGVSGVHSRVVHESDETEFDKMIAELIKESNKKRSTKKANQGGYVNNLPTTYAQEGLYFEDDPRSQEIQSLDSEIQKIRSDRERMIDVYKRVGQASDEKAVERGASAYNPRLSPLLQKRSDLVESAYSPEGSQISETVSKAPSDSAFIPAPPKNLSGTGVISETSAAEEGGPNEAQLKRLGVSREVFNKFSEGGKWTLMKALNATTPFRRSGAPSIIRSTLKQEAEKIRQEGSSPVSSIVNYFTGTPEKGAEIKAKSDAATKTASTIIAAANKELGNPPTKTVDRKDDDRKKDGGPNFIPKANAMGSSAPDSLSVDELSTDIRGEVHQPIVSAKKAAPVQVSFEDMAANKRFLEQSVKDNVGGTDGSEKKVKELTKNGHNTLVALYKRELGKLGITKQKAFDLGAWEKGEKEGDETAYSLLADIGNKSQDATKSYIESLEADRKKLNKFAETGKLPEGRRSQLLNNILITFGASLLGNASFSDALSQGLLGSLKLQKGAEDAYADALNDNLKATKQIGDLKMKALEIANATRRDIIMAKQADKKANFLQRNQIEANIIRRQNLSLNLQKAIFDSVIAKRNSDSQMMAAQKLTAAERGLKTERNRAINSLIADYRSQLDEAGNDRAKIQAVNQKFKDVFTKKKGLLYLDIGNPLDGGVNKYLDKIGAPWYAKTRRTGVDPAVTESKLRTEQMRRENIGAQARGRVFKTVREVTSGDRKHKKDTSKYWNQFKASPAGARFKGVEKYNAKDPEQSRAFQSWLLTQPLITEGSPVGKKSGYTIRKIEKN